MIALDTNVIVRFLVRDDEEQAQAVYTRFKAAETSRKRLFVPLVVVLELIWVLDSAYGMSRHEILHSIASLYRMPVLQFEAGSVLEHFLALAEGRVEGDAKENTIELDDLLIALSAKASGCDAMITFDKKAARFPFFQTAF